MFFIDLKDGTLVHVTFDIPDYYGDGALNLNCYFNILKNRNPLGEKIPFSIPSIDLVSESSMKKIYKWARHIAKGYSSNSKKLKTRCKLTTYENGKYNSWNFIFSYQSSKDPLPNFPGKFYPTK